MENERKQTLLAEVGSFLIDIAKLVFGGVILAGIRGIRNNQSNDFVYYRRCCCIGMLFGRAGVYRIF